MRRQQMNFLSVNELQMDSIIAGAFVFLRIDSRYLVSCPLVINATPSVLSIVLVALQQDDVLCG